MAEPRIQVCFSPLCSRKKRKGLGPTDYPPANKANKQKKQSSSPPAASPRDRDRETDTHDQLDERLGRLSNKTGVRATLVLDRATGAVLKTSGDVAALAVTTQNRSTPPPPAPAATTAEGPATAGDPAGAAGDTARGGVERYAGLVWRFVVASGGLLHDVDAEV